MKDFKKLKCNCDTRMKLIDFDFLLWHIQHLKQHHREEFEIIKHACIEIEDIEK